jgi:RNA polymerase sigma factor (sigma-70 family)
VPTANLIRARKGPVSESRRAEQSSTGQSLDWANVTNRIRSGDQSAEGELYAVFSRGIRYYLARHLGPEHLEDRVHDCFIVCIQAIRKGQVQEPERLMGFVRTIVQRMTWGSIGKLMEDRSRFCASDITVLDRHCHNHSTPETELIEKERHQLALEEIARLSTRDREILTRFYLEGQEKEQICSDMNLTETQFRLIKSRTKARLTLRVSRLRSVPTLTPRGALSRAV